MLSVRPKTIESGGISPNGWTSVFTLLMVMIFSLAGEDHVTAYRQPKPPDALQDTQI
jgi:hypothetical protein